VSTDTLIVDITLEQRQMLLFQALLQGEEGLAVVRCFDEQHRHYELWSTPAQQDSLLHWLRALPAVLNVRIQGIRRWQDMA